MVEGVSPMWINPFLKFPTVNMIHTHHSNDILTLDLFFSDSKYIPLIEQCTNGPLLLRVQSLYEFILLSYHIISNDSQRKWTLESALSFKEDSTMISTDDSPSIKCEWLIRNRSPRIDKRNCVVFGRKNENSLGNGFLPIPISERSRRLISTYEEYQSVKLITVLFFVIQSYICWHNNCALQLYWHTVRAILSS